MALAQFLGALGAPELAGLGLVGGPRGMPHAIPSFDPNTDPQGPLVAAQGGQPDFSGVGPIAQPNMDRVQGSLDMLGSPAPDIRGGGGGFLSKFIGQPFSGVREVAGRLGDALLDANDMRPIYAPRQEEHRQRQVGEALAQFLGPDFAEIARLDPNLAMEARNKDQKYRADDLDMIGETENRLMQLLGATQSQEQYDAALQRARNIYGARFGLNLDDLGLPTQWSPQTAAMFRNQGATPAQQLAGVNRERRLDWDIEDDVTDNERADRNLDDQIGHRAGQRESLERYRQGRLGVTKRGQDLTDSRQRDRGPPAGARSPASASGNLPLIRTPAEASRLPRGTRFRTPDGKVKVVP